MTFDQLVPVITGGIGAGGLAFAAWMSARNKASDQVHRAEAQLREFLERANQQLRDQLSNSDERLTEMGERFVATHAELVKYRIEVHDLRNELGNIRSIQAITIKPGGKRHYDPPEVPK